MDIMDHTQGASQGEFLCKVNQKLLRWLIQSIFSTATFVLEVVFSVYIHSSVIEADGVMHLYDAIIVMVALTSKLIGYERTTRNTFGWVRIEAMGELIAAVFVLSLSCGLFPHVMRMFIIGEHVKNLGAMFYLLLLSLSVKLSGLLLTFEMHYNYMCETPQLSPVTGKILPPPADTQPVGTPRKRRRGSRFSFSKLNSVEKVSANDSKILTVSNQVVGVTRQLSLQKSILHLQAHFCSTIFAFVMLLVLFQARTPDDFNNSSWQHALEQAAGIVVTLINCARVCPTLWRTSLVFMQSVPRNVDMAILKRSLGGIPNVTDIHELHVWQLRGAQLMCQLHVRMKHIQHFPPIARQIKDILHEFNIHACTIQPEIEGSKGAVRGCGRCLLDCPLTPNGSHDCKDRQCCGGKVDPYTDLPTFRRRSESLGRIEHHLLKHITGSTASPALHHGHAHAHAAHIPPALALPQKKLAHFATSPSSPKSNLEALTASPVCGDLKVINLSSKEPLIVQEVHDHKHCHHHLEKPKRKHEKQHEKHEKHEQGDHATLKSGNSRDRHCEFGDGVEMSVLKYEPSETASCSKPAEMSFMEIAMAVDNQSSNSFLQNSSIIEEESE